MNLGSAFATFLEQLDCVLQNVSHHQRRKLVDNIFARCYSPDRVQECKTTDTCSLRMLLPDISTQTVSEATAVLKQLHESTPKTLISQLNSELGKSLISLDISLCIERRLIPVLPPIRIRSDCRMHSKL